MMGLSLRVIVALMFASGPRNQINCAALANESGELPVNLEPDWRSCRNRMDEHGVDNIDGAGSRVGHSVKVAVSAPRSRSKLWVG